MARENRRASSGLYRLGGIREEPGAVAAELGPRREPRGAAGRQSPSAGDRLLRRLWSEDERSKPVCEREPFALLRLRAGLPRRGRKIMPVYDLTPDRCGRGGGIPDGRLAGEYQGGNPGNG